MRLAPKVGDVLHYDNSNLFETMNFNLDDLNPPKMEYMIHTEKDRVKLVKTVERMVRSSMEYKDYIKFLKEYINMTKCSFWGKVAGGDYSGIKIEIHHAPFTLYDITMAVLIKHEEEYGDLNLFFIAEEVMKLHYQCKVGLIPLSETCHQLVHNGDLFIPVQFVRGNFMEFVKEYGGNGKNYIPEDLKMNLRKQIRFSQEVQDVSLLETKYTYMDVEGFRYPSLIHEKEFLQGIYGKK